MRGTVEPQPGEMSTALLEMLRRPLWSGVLKAPAGMAALALCGHLRACPLLPKKPFPLAESRGKALWPELRGAAREGFCCCCAKQSQAQGPRLVAAALPLASSISRSHWSLGRSQAQICPCLCLLEQRHCDRGPREEGSAGIVSPLPLQPHLSCPSLPGHHGTQGLI